MKVLQVYKDVFPEVHGGIERYIHDLSAFLSCKGHSVEVLVAGGGEREINGFSVKGVWSPLRILSNPVVPGFTKYLKNTDADVVQFHLPLPSAVLAWTMLSKNRKKPYIVTYHSDIVRQAFVMPVYAPVLEGFLRSAVSVIVSSEKYISSSPYLQNLKNTQAIPIGVDLERFKPDTSAQRKYYLFVGRFREYKGIFVLLEAWRKMKKPPKLILAGGGRLIHSVNRFIEKHRLPVSVVTDATDDELIRLYQHAKALILPSIRRSEAYGMVQVEAMACGTPVISSNLPTGVSWVNRDRETGYLFATGDSSDLKDAVLKIEKHETDRISMSTAARDRAEKCFSGVELFERVENCLTGAAGI